MKQVRQIIFYQGHFHAFYHAQNRKVQRKIDEVLFMISILERVPSKFLEHLTGTDGLFEIRIEWSGSIFRVFCCFDEGRLVVLFNGFQKKTQKTPKTEIDKAEKLKVAYFKEKYDGKAT
ncbi:MULTISPECIES: type II toxin-antitoxin system RelE/ParE family toxin [unclassified Flavobacterium]|uniref:type II toxin-antitoxin system RelE/ParE family toxin n=1 Tax=unclassified Flavobacterium TaxID=196869 RepID=UPI001F130D75|nr:MULTISPECIES: type II toxin-antitoxin system RelE/ParE family toxin [unclassified Flavobacterium]UMY65372.1 type II toxin-antitoxin system RelE/ParE family toxin [Flavobacterium sp. HJ-32-4]